MSSMQKRFAMFVVLMAVFVFAAMPVLVCHAANPQTITGKSTDTKPTSVPDGSQFTESDTGYVWTFRVYPDHTRAWVRTTTGSATSFYLAALSSTAASAITASAAELNTMTGITATVTELNHLASSPAGTATASKAAVLGANKNLDEFHTATLYLGAAAGTAVTSTAAELNKTHGAPASITTTATPATGTNGAQFVFKDAAGVAITRVFSGIAYVSDINGAHSTAVTSLAALVNGSLTTLVTGKVIEFTTKNDGTLGITTTASAGPYYITFVLPQGIIATSTVLTVN